LNTAKIAQLSNQTPAKKPMCKVVLKLHIINNVSIVSEETQLPRFCINSL